MIGLLVRWLFARHPLYATATGGKTEAEMLVVATLIGPLMS